MIFRNLLCGVLCFASCHTLASGLGASRWEQLRFKTSDGDVVEVILGKGSTIELIKLKTATCEGTFPGATVPGVVFLNGVEYFSDFDMIGPITVLTVPFLREGDEQSVIAFRIRNCNLIGTEIY